MPVGISFYTFQALSYSIDVYRQQIEPTKDIIAFFAFISFFPQLVAGPIERATNLLPQFLSKRTFSYEQATDGMRQILWGLFKKMVIADNCAVYVDKVFSDYTVYSGSTLLLAAILFTFQIYGDFSGYSDIAIGTAKLFGIRLMRNFNNPYFSRDIAEFWRRWHISLTTWFRDYVYIPLGGSRPNIPDHIHNKERYTRLIIIRNTFTIFLLSGFWHGANWTYIVWGLYHALLFLPLILLGKNRKYTNQIAEDRMLPAFKECMQMIVTFCLVVFGWIIFRSTDIYEAGSLLCRIYSMDLFTIPLLMNRAYYVPTFLNLLILIIIEWNCRNKEILKFNINRCWRWGVYLALILIIYKFGVFKYQHFIYFQF